MSNEMTVYLVCVFAAVTEAATAMYFSDGTACGVWPLLPIINN